MNRAELFNVFASSHHGIKIFQAIYDAAKHHVDAYAKLIDPNWSFVNFVFDDKVNDPCGFRNRDTNNPQAYTYVCEYQPSSVVLHGPLHGNVDMTKDVFRLIPEPLMAYLRQLHAINGRIACFSIPNINHDVQLIEGKTFIHLASGSMGVVRTVHDHEFQIELISDVAHDPPHILNYNFDRLEMELLEGTMEFPETLVDYFPFIDANGAYIKSVEALRVYLAHEAAEQADMKRTTLPYLGHGIDTFAPLQAAKQYLVNPVQIREDSETS